MLKHRNMCCMLQRVPAVVSTLEGGWVDRGRLGRTIHGARLGFGTPIIYGIRNILRGSVDYGLSIISRGIEVRCSTRENFEK